MDVDDDVTEDASVSLLLLLLLRDEREDVELTMAVCGEQREGRDGLRETSRGAVQWTARARAVLYLSDILR